MPTQRRSDENSNPDHELETKPRITTIKVESKANISKIFKQSNEASSSTNKRELTAFQKKEKARFEKSGMKKGSLVKYLVKEDNPEEMQGNTRRSTRNRSSSTNTTNVEAGNVISRNAGNENHRRNSEVDRSGVTSQQISSGNVIAISSESGESVSVNQGDFEADSPQVSDYDVGEYDINQNEHHDVEFVINNLDNQELSGEDKIERWQRQNKRMLQDDQHSSSRTDGYSELQPPPSKASKLEILAREEKTPDNSQGSNTSTPPLRIVNVYTLSRKDDATPGTSTGSSERSAVEKAKKSISFYKEIENPTLGPLIKKKNWRKIIDIVSKDFKEYKLPAKFVFSELIRRAILCEGTRVSKDVQSDSVTFLEEVMKSYPPHKGNGRDPSVKYYKEILEKVFDDENSSASNRCKLNHFLEEIHKRLGVEKNAIQILVLVTRLVVNQYDVYEKEAGVKVHPPLFQYFLEEKEGVFTYNRFCQNILGKCFKAEADEVFCIYLKWIDLISRRLGNFAIRRKDYLQMVKDFAKHCSGQNDLGLSLLMNLTYKPFSKLICETIFERLTIIRVDGEENEDEIPLSETDRNFYLTELCKTLLITPAGDIVSDVVEEVCKGSSGLSFSRLKVDANQSNQQTCDNRDGRGRKKNVKGETRLHILCRPGQENTVSEVSKHLQTYPEDINVRDNFGNTPLHDCAKYNKGNIILGFIKLYEKRKLTQIDFLARNESMETPMHLAATYCDERTTEMMIFFASSCGVIDDLLKMANKDGKLPFQLAPAKSQIERKLTPSGYDKDEMLTHEGMILDKQSVEELENNFELRKILAWWSQNCL